MDWEAKIKEGVVRLSEKKVRFYLDLARTAGLQSTCPRAQVGAILVRNDRVVGLGYNGAPRGTPHCALVGCLMEQDSAGVEHCYRAVHAEANAIVNAAYSGGQTRGSSMICQYSPCVHCLKLLINAGVHEVYYDQNYADVRTLNLMALNPNIWLHQI